MAAADYYTQVYTMFVGYFGRPPAQSGLDYYANIVNASGGKLNAVLDDFHKAPESQALFAGKSTEQQVNQIFKNLFGRDALPAGLNYWVGEINSGRVALSQAAYAISQGAATADKAVLTAKIDSAKLWVAGLDTTAEILIYSSDSGRTAGRDFLNTVTTSTPAAQTAVDAALSSMVGGGNTNPGQTFTLTIGEDNKLGGAGNDTFNAPAVEGKGGIVNDSLESFDVLDGGAGTDTLNATITTGTPAPVLKNIENVNIRFAAAKSVDLTSATGVTTVKVENSTATGTVNGVGSAGTLSVANQLKDVSFDNSTATTLGLSLNTVANAAGATQVVVDLGATKGHKATTLNITANNANVEVKDSNTANVTTTLSIAATGTNSLKLTEAVKATAVTVTGTGSADLTAAAFTGALTKFDAAANEGGVKADIQSTKAAVVTTGKGNDLVKMDTAVVNDTSVALGAGTDVLYTGGKLGNFTKGVDGGDGTDIISINDGAVLDATTSKYIANFETLDVSGGKGNYDVSLNSFATVQIDEAIGGALAGDVDFKNAADTFTLTIASKAKDTDFDVVKNITVTGKDYTGTTAKGTAETFTLVANLNDGDKDNTAEGSINAQTLTVAGVENLVIDANVKTLDGGTDALKASKSTLTAKFTAAAAETLTIKGDASVDLSSVTTIGVLTKVDASGSTGNMKIDLSGHAVSVGYTGSEGVDTYLASAKGDSIYAGKGADVITLNGAAARDTFVLKAATDSQLVDSSKDGKLTLAADSGFDAVTAFVTGGGLTADRIDLTNFGFTGTQRGVENVSAKVAGTTDLTNVVDLFSAVAGDRGVAYSNLGGADAYVFIDVNKDGDFTAASDIVIKLTGVANIAESDINF